MWIRVLMGALPATASSLDAGMEVSLSSPAHARTHIVDANSSESVNKKISPELQRTFS